MKYLLCMSLTLAGAAAHCVFDFEGESTGFPTSVAGTLDGVDFTLTRSTGGFFEIRDTGAAIFGDRSGVHAGADEWMWINFDSAMGMFSLEMGDYGVDDEVFLLEAYSGVDVGGSMLDSDTDSYTSSINVGDAATLMVSSQTGFRSIRFRGIGDGGNSNYFFDNFDGQAVPEPGAIALLSLAGMALSRRRKKS